MTFKDKSFVKLTYDAAMLLFGLYPQKTIIEKDACTPRFIAALFTIAGTWKQPRYPSTDEWIKKLCTYTQWNVTRPKKGMPLSQF